jgi:hypothetical protein
VQLPREQAGPHFSTTHHPPTFVPLTVAKTAVFFLRLYTHNLRMLFGPEGRCVRNAGVLFWGTLVRMDLQINSSRFSSAMGVSVVNGRCAFAMQESREETIGSRRSRSRWLRMIRSVSVALLATYENGYFYIAQSGHSHFAATTLHLYLTQSRKDSIAPSQHRNVPTLRNSKYFHPALRAVCSLLSHRASLLSVRFLKWKLPKTASFHV